MLKWIMYWMQKYKNIRMITQINVPVQNNKHQTHSVKTVCRVTNSLALGYTFQNTSPLKEKYRPNKSFLCTCQYKLSILKWAVDKIFCLTFILY